jgi:hypothetical protein
MMGSYYRQIFNITVQFNYQLSRHTEQYLSEQSPYSSLTIPRVPLQSTSTGLSRAGFSTQLKTTLHSDLYSLPVQTPTALEVKF